MISTSTPSSLDNRLISSLNEKQKYWLNKAVEFAENIPLIDTINSDKDNIFRKDLFQKACLEGFGSLPFNKEYGGQGGDYFSFVLVNEEFAKRCVPIMSSLGVHVLSQEPIYRFGSTSQKQKYLPKSSKGEYLAAFGLTEPAAGSDTAALESTAYLKADKYILNGTKVFITSGASSDYFIVMCRLIDNDIKSLSENKKDKSITAFIVEKDFPGFKIGQKFDMLGMRGYSTCELVFDDCIVPKENLLGEHGQGRKVALSSLAKGRVTIAAQCTGWAQGALDALIKTSKMKKNNKSVFEKYMSTIGEMAALVESARALTYQAAWSIDKGQSDITLASMAKTQASDVAMKVASEVMTILGIESLEPNLLLERIFRDAKAGQIYEGANQIQRLLIARDLLQTK